jgi:DNA-directed RNA polymerase subunit RPC12/RpoP
MNIENCSNCGRVIGKLEQAYIIQGKIVCEDCNKRLNPNNKKMDTKGMKFLTSGWHCLLGSIISVSLGAYCSFYYKLYILLYLCPLIFIPLWLAAVILSIMTIGKTNIRDGVTLLVMCFVLPSVVAGILIGGKEFGELKETGLFDTQDNTSYSPTSAKRISPSDFEIVSYRGVWEDERLIIKGEIRNNGRVAGGPKIEVIAKDAKGELLDSRQFWPNSTNNIPPGGTCGIECTISRDKRAKTIEAKVIGVDVW